MTFFNATKLTVAGLLTFLFWLTTGRLTGSLRPAKRSSHKHHQRRSATGLLQRWRQPSGDGWTRMKLPSLLSTLETSLRSRP